MLVIAGTVLLLAVVGLLYFWLFVSDDISPKSAEPIAEQKAEKVTVAPVQLFAMTEVNIRDQPTTFGSTIIGKMPRGSMLSGVVKSGDSSSTDWLELSEGKGFVATANLSDLQPPQIVKSLGNRIWVSDTRLDILGPSTDNELIESAPAGTRLILSGLVANGVLEVKLSDGRYGYILEGKDIVARLGGKPIAIQFDPGQCKFGTDLDAEFEKIGTRLRSKWAAFEATEFADDAARERAIAAIEGRSTYQRLPRSFEGLTVTAIAQHYESQSVYFAEPVSKVVEVFRGKGFRVARDGSIPSTELYAGVSATRGEGTAYGKSELGCGV